MTYKTSKLLVKGATSRGSRRFLAQTILKLVVANLIHSEHFSEHLKEHINIIRKEKTNHGH